MTHIAVCPGSYDPITLGHLDVIEKSLKLFDEVHVLVVHNPNKQPMFSTEKRVELITECLAERGIVENVVISSLTKGLLVGYCQEVGASALVKGIRASTDVVYEMPMAVVNRDLADVETVFILPQVERSHVSSSLVRQVAELGGDVKPYVPGPVVEALGAINSLLDT